LSGDVRQQFCVAGELHGVLAAQPLGTFTLSGNDQGGDLDDLAFTAGGRACQALCASDMFLGGHGVTAGGGTHCKERLLDRGHRSSRAGKRQAACAPVWW
jgi:hypothetical protein